MAGMGSQMARPMGELMSSRGEVEEKGSLGPTISPLGNHYKTVTSNFFFGEAYLLESLSQWPLRPSVSLKLM